MQASESAALDEDRQIYDAKFHGLKVQDVGGHYQGIEYDSGLNSSRDEWDCQSSIHVRNESAPTSPLISPIDSPIPPSVVHDNLNLSNSCPITLNSAQQHENVVAASEISSNHHDIDNRCDGIVNSLDKLVFLQEQLLLGIESLTYQLHDQQQRLRRSVRDSELQLLHLSSEMEELTREHSRRQLELVGLASRKSELEAFIAAAAHAVLPRTLAIIKREKPTHPFRSHLLTSFPSLSLSLPLPTSQFFYLSLCLSISISLPPS
jgi:hypothetical protein